MPALVDGQDYCVFRLRGEASSVFVWHVSPGVLASCWCGHGCGCVGTLATCIVSTIWQLQIGNHPFV